MSREGWLKMWRSKVIIRVWLQTHMNFVELAASRHRDEHVHLHLPFAELLSNSISCAPSRLNQGSSFCRDFCKGVLQTNSDYQPRTIRWRKFEATLHAHLTRWGESSNEDKDGSYETWSLVQVQKFTRNIWSSLQDWRNDRSLARFKDL